MMTEPVRLPASRYQLFTLSACQPLITRKGGVRRWDAPLQPPGTKSLLPESSQRRIKGFLATRTYSHTHTHIIVINTESYTRNLETWQDISRFTKHITLQLVRWGRISNVRTLRGVAMFTFIFHHKSEKQAGSVFSGFYWISGLPSSL